MGEHALTMTHVTPVTHPKSDEPFDSLIHDLSTHAVDLCVLNHSFTAMFSAKSRSSAWVAEYGTN